MEGMRSVLLAALLAVVPAYADTPRTGVGPAPVAPGSAALAPVAPKAAPVAPKAAPAAPKAAPVAPGSNGQRLALPSDVLQDAVTRAATAAGTGALGMDGERAAGVVIEPPAHPDAQAWPYGIAMTPPETRDRMLIAPGTNAISAELRVATSWGKHLVDAAFERAGKLLELVLPRSL